MKTALLITFLILSSTVHARTILRPESGSTYRCVNRFNGLRYVLKIEDVGDESGDVLVLKPNGQIAAHYEENGPKLAQVNMYRDGFSFILVDNGEDAGAIEFKNYDLQSAFYVSPDNDYTQLNCKK